MRDYIIKATLEEGAFGHSTQAAWLLGWCGPRRKQ